MEIKLSTLTWNLYQSTQVFFFLNKLINLSETECFVDFFDDILVILNVILNLVIVDIMVIIKYYLY